MVPLQAVISLMEMGFDEKEVMDALRVNNNQQSAAVSTSRTSAPRSPALPARVAPLGEPGRAPVSGGPLSCCRGSRWCHSSTCFMYGESSGPFFFFLSLHVNFERE